MIPEDLEQIPPPRRRLSDGGYRHERIVGPPTEQEMMRLLSDILAKAVPRELMQRLGKEGSINVTWDNAFRVYLRANQCRKTFCTK